eukprot:Blabericola_migrator_1__317@NODE_1081_length_5498_cov_180_853802_g740_i0_p4_GENE_NODE_1081_length_5498_cov_180_853802_g740_i0NODE_1081_length_5498_cov_180_853802_g740_i0_p4_ORF_typecomplete_len314_score86_98Borrelia_P83/PF05262_11/1_8e04Borrelia_P83/PF05262_11/2_4e08MAD/PF05557_13/0_0021MAD/PF05557_13/23SAA/PF00277_18/64SAA/PF00277_18/7_7TFA2_Winged_2/PF18121_1/33TFA2_Winged_2/PF18121_1/16HC2/PF07382_11/1_3e03HC2/PF07382_11/0_075Leu_zip/PF15294_6/1_4Leu_zip/PF15294_6/69_NODE_1081_length_5498_cov
MSPQIEKLQDEQVAIQKEIEALEAEKKKEELEIEALEHKLDAAKHDLESAQATANPAVDYEELKAEIRRGLLARHAGVAKEIDDGWEAHVRYLESMKADLEKEMNESISERKKLQAVKLKLREAGVAEFQTYTPSEIGGGFDDGFDTAPPQNIAPISYSAERQSSTALVAVSSPHTVPPTPGSKDESAAAENEQREQSKREAEDRAAKQQKEAADAAQAKRQEQEKQMRETEKAAQERAKADAAKLQEAQRDAAKKEAADREAAKKEADTRLAAERQAAEKEAEAAANPTGRGLAGLHEPGAAEVTGLTPAEP